MSSDARPEGAAVTQLLAMHPTPTAEGRGIGHVGLRTRSRNVPTSRTRAHPTSPPRASWPSACCWEWHRRSRQPRPCPP